jgi:hypothetical protein
MSIGRARLTLFLIFVISFLVQVVAIFYSLRRGTIYGDNVTSFVKGLLSIYSVHLGVVVAGSFAQIRTTGPARTASKTPFWTALVLAGTWNALLAGRTLYFSLGSNDSIDDLMAYLTMLASGGSFLVAGALTYFFSHKSS